jgi:hypothetical protein
MTGNKKAQYNNENAFFASCHRGGAEGFAGRTA